MSEPFDLDGLMQQAMSMQRQLAEAQETAAEAEVEGSSGGGSVVVTMTGTGEVIALRIAPEVVDPDDVELLEDLVLAALRDAGARVAALQAGALGELVDLSGLTGLLGGAGGDDRGAIDVELAPGERGGELPPVDEPPSR